MRFRVTVRHGRQRKGYHIFEVEASDVAAAMEAAAGAIPDGVLDGADLVEVRPSVDSESREYVGE